MVEFCHRQERNWVVIPVVELLFGAGVLHVECWMKKEKRNKERADEVEEEKLQFAKERCTREGGEEKKETKKI